MLSQSLAQIEEIALQNEVRKIKVYNAGPWFCKKDREAINRAHEVLSADLALDVYSPLHCCELNIRAYSHLPLDAPTAMYYAANAERTNSERREVFLEDVKQIIACDAITAMIENWDQGTIFEMGMAYMRQFIEVTHEHGPKRPIIIAWSYNPIRRANLMLQQSIDAFTISVEDLPAIIKKEIANDKRTS